MQQKNLEKMITAVINTISDMEDIDIVDRTEFMINLNKFVLDYEINIRTLNEENEKRKRLR